MDNTKVLSTEAYIIYLRKSRADNPKESVEEVLAKHETMLQEYAERELGGRIPESCIYREVVSGETIDERPEMLKVLQLIENPERKAVLVVEPQRLSRGDLEDCGRLVNAFRYTSTLVMTLNMTYDLRNKMERKFFEQELMRGNDFLEYTKEILHRGRIASIKKGNYIGNIPPYGYDKHDLTLIENDKADVVRLIFDMYVNEGKNYLQIARHLDSIGVKPSNGEIWEKSSVRFILSNIHYAGYVVYGKHKTERTMVNGEVVKQRNTPADKDETVIAKGRHKAIIPEELFEAAQNKMRNNPRAKIGYPLKNPLAGLIFCKKCGKAIVQHPYKRARTRLECRNRNGCGSKSVAMDDLIETLINALENEHLPELETKLKNNDGNSLVIQQKQIKALQEELGKLHAQEDNQYDLLETGFYTKAKFEERNKELHEKMDVLKARIYELKQALPPEVNYQEKIVRLKDAINGLRNEDISIEAKNRLLKAIVKRIDYEYVAWLGKGNIDYILHIELLV